MTTNSIISKNVNKKPKMGAFSRLQICKFNCDKDGKICSMPFLATLRTPSTESKKV